MNRPSFYLSMFRYAVTHPMDGLRILEAACEVREDSKHRLVADVKTNGLKDCLKALFPDLGRIEKNESLSQLEDQLCEFFEKIKSEEYPSMTKPYPIEYSVDNDSGLFLYELCKALKPEIIVETGVAYGRSTSYILQALHENQKGKLYSIDYVFTPWQSKQAIGSAIPNHLRYRWEMVYGPTSEELPNLLDSLGMIDVFFHDSLHTYKTMNFEFQQSWPHIRQNGFLLSDDAKGNNAFHNFCSIQKLKPLYLVQEFGADAVMGILQKKNEV